MNKKIAVVIICLVCLRLAYGGDKLLTYETRYDNPIQAIRYSPDNKYLVIGTRNKVHIEDVAKGKGVKNLDVAGEVMDFSRDGKYLALGQNGGIQVFDVSSWECIQTIAPYTVMSFKFSPDGKYIANGANTTKIVEIWEVSSGKCIKTLEGHM